VHMLFNISRWLSWSNVTFLNSEKSLYKMNENDTPIAGWSWGRLPQLLLSKLNYGLKYEFSMCEYFWQATKMYTEVAKNWEVWHVYSIQSIQGRSPHSWARDWTRMKTVYLSIVIFNDTRKKYRSLPTEFRLITFC
jgi:hypothetical protein